jgi:LysR family glycine cleavage system transcriptional activator
MGQGGWEGLQQQHLFDDELVVVAAPDFRQGKLPRTPAEIVAGPVVRTVESWMGWCQAAGVEEPSQAGLWINDSNLVLQAVTQGMGVALERRSLVHAGLQSGVLVQLSDIVVPYPYPHWLVWPQRESSLLKQRDFAGWMAEEVAAYQEELAQTAR